MVVERPILTARQLEVVALVAEGYSNKEIARMLALRAKSVANHLEQIRARLGLRNRAHLAAWYVAHYQLSPLAED